MLTSALLLPASRAASLQTLASSAPDMPADSLATMAHVWLFNSREAYTSLVLVQSRVLFNC